MSATPTATVISVKQIGNAWQLTVSCPYCGRTHAERELEQLVPVWERLWLAVTSLPP